MEKLKENLDKKKEIKDARIHLRTTTTNKELLQAKAQNSQMTLSDFMIAASLGLEINQVTPAIDKSLYVELCRQGNNINQLARLQNTIAASGLDPELDVDELKTLENIQTLLEQILIKLKDKS